jgi:hypothetical protein
VLGEDYASAIQHGEECIAAATTYVDRIMGSLIIAHAQILSGRLNEGMALISHVRAEAEANDWSHLFNAIDGPLGVALVLTGRLKDGLSLLTAFVQRGDREGNVVAADFARMFLAEIYLALLVGDRRPPLRAIVRDAFVLIKAKLRASSEVQSLLGAALRNPFFSPTGLYRARIEFGLGRFYRSRQRPDLARAHLERARLAAAEQGAAAMMARIDTNLAAIPISPV